MAAPSAITTVRAGLGIKLGTHKVLTASTSVATAAKYPDLIYKICLFHCEAQRYTNLGSALLRTNYLLPFI